MRVAFLAPVYQMAATSVRASGGVISNRVLIERLALDHNVMVDVAYADSAGPGYPLGRRGGLKVWGAMPVSEKSRIKRFIAARRWRRSAVRRALDYRPDIILASTGAVPTALVAGRLLRVPVIAIVRAFEHFRTAEGGKWNRLRDIQWGCADTQALSKCDGIIFCSRYLEDLYTPFLPEVRATVIYPPLDLPEVGQVWSGRTDRVLLVGDSAAKGWDVVAELAANDPSRSYGNTGRAATSGAKSKLFPLAPIGWVSDRTELFEKFDVVVVPSRREPFGRVAVEALSQGKGVLVAATGGLPEAVGYEAALIVESRHWSEWYARLNWMRDRAEEAGEAVARARSRVEQFSVENQYRKFADALAVYSTSR